MESSWLFLGQPHHTAALRGSSLEALVGQGVIIYSSMEVVWQSPVPSTPPHKYTRTIKKKKYLNLQERFRIYFQSEQNPLEQGLQALDCFVKDKQQPPKGQKTKEKAILKQPFY